MIYLLTLLWKWKTYTSHIIFYLSQLTNDLFTVYTVFTLSCHMLHVSHQTSAKCYQSCSTRWFHWFYFPPSLASNYVLFKFYWLIIWCAAAEPAWLPGFSNPLLSVSVSGAWAAGRATGRELIRLVALYKCTLDCTLYRTAGTAGGRWGGSQNSHCTTWHDTYLVIIMGVGLWSHLYVTAHRSWLMIWHKLPASPRINFGS